MSLIKVAKLYQLKLAIYQMTLPEALNFMDIKSFNFTTEQLNKIYKQKAFQLHPDNKDTGSHDKFILLQQAYKLLSNYVPLEEEEDEEEDYQHQTDPEFDPWLDSLPRNNFITKRITFGEYSLSIQAGPGHYSDPQKNLDKLSDYDAYELAIFKNNKMINPRTDPLYKELPEDVLKYWGPKNVDVGALMEKQHLKAIVAKTISAKL